MLTDCSVKCLGACTRRAFGDARRCQRVSQRWNRYHPYFITGEAAAAGDRRSVLQIGSQPCTPLLRSTSSGPVQSSPLEAGLCSTAVTALVSLPRALLKESGGDLTDHCKASCRSNQGGGFRDPHLHPQHSRRGCMAGRGLELRLPGLDSVKLKKVICDFNKAEGSEELAA